MQPVASSCRSGSRNRKGAAMPKTSSRLSITFLVVVLSSAISELYEVYSIGRPETFVLTPHLPPIVPAGLAGAHSSRSHSFDLSRPEQAVGAHQQDEEHDHVRGDDAD